MTPDTVISLVRQGIEVALILAGPMLLASVVVGLLVSVFQAATQINEMTLTFIPKLIAEFLVIVIFGPWMIRLLVDYITRLYGSIPTLVG
jgi:flagellar biosynthetic protein FliQ